jgi:hypothetical protein
MQAKRNVMRPPPGSSGCTSGASGVVAEGITASEARKPCDALLGWPSRTRRPGLVFSAFHLTGSPASSYTAGVGHEEMTHATRMRKEPSNASLRTTQC